ncbi:MAG: aldehyde dehydrogenase family protein, partial [Flammeovirgaceae bacterium]|nr:aldehyde dehydrogenase family protein [Flammeovirgaceae bacterium]
MDETQKIDTPLEFLGTALDIWYEPKGVCLIISPWNFPMQLCLLSASILSGRL